jgi:hypothetical protein
MSSAQSSRQVLLGFLAAAALVHQALDQWAHGQFGWDKVDQLAGAARLHAGHGLTLPELNALDLARPLARPLVGWPPGYSYLATALLHAGLGIWQAAFVIDTIAAGLYLASWYVLMAHSGLGRHSRLWLWLFWALAYCPLVRLTSSDQLAAGLFSAALALGMVSVQAGSIGPPGKQAWKAAVAATLAGTTAGLAGAVRFAYWPLAAVVPVGLAAWGGRYRRPAAVLCAVSAGLVLAVLAWHQRATTGHTTYLTSLYARPAETWQWPSLARIDPFPAGALGLDVFWQRAHEWLHLPGSLRVGTWCLASLVTAAYVAAFLRAYGRHEPSGPIAKYLYGTGVVALVLTLAMLCWLSLRYPPIGEWTHVQELRYYAPVFGFLTVAWFGSPHLALGAPTRETFLRLHIPGAWRPWQWFASLGTMGEISRLRRGLALGLAALVLATVAGGGIWRARRWWRVAAGTTPRPQHSAVFDAEGVFVQSQVAALVAQGSTVYYIDERLDRRAMARLAGAVVPLPHELPRQPNTSAGVVMVAPDDQWGEAARAVVAHWPLVSVRHVAGRGTGLWQYQIAANIARSSSDRPQGK